MTSWCGMSPILALVAVAQVARQLFPRGAAIARAVEILRAEVDRVGIVRRELDRRQHLHAQRILARRDSGDGCSSSRCGAGGAAGAGWRAAPAPPAHRRHRAPRRRAGAAML